MQTQILLAKLWRSQDGEKLSGAVGFDGMLRIIPNPNPRDEKNAHFLAVLEQHPSADGKGGKIARNGPRNAAPTFGYPNPLRSSSALPEAFSARRDVVEGEVVD